MSYSRRQKRKLRRDIIKRYPNTLIATWTVTAEYIKKSQELGTFYGNVFDIAKALSGVSCQFLKFKKVSNNKRLYGYHSWPPQKKFVYIAIDGMPLISYEAMILLKKLAIKREPHCIWNLVVNNGLKLEFLD